MIDFTLPAEVAELAERTRAFVAREVIPREDDPRALGHGPSDDLRRELQALARAEGLLAPHVGREWGGLGLDHRGKAVVFEAAGYGTLGPLALNIAAPDEGNMHLLEAVARADQKERWLRPLAAGAIRSCFLMTEPPPGSGSDPSMLATTATPDGDGWRIDGVKWFITGAEGASLHIVMARSAPKVEGRRGATMFLLPHDTPGIRIVRRMATMDQSFPGGHCEIALEGVRAGPETVLGAVDEGFGYAQVRLAPARLTHCMRWLGAATRAHDVATTHARTRAAFGKTLGEHEGVSFMLADNAIDLQAARMLIWHAAWTLDQGRSGGQESGLAKVFCAEALFRVVDRAMQILGGLGVSQDRVVERIFRDIRAFRIYDGPSEVHRWAIGNRVLRGPRAQLN
jgi:alkylation response protein AidB-like acyl-CoA dehydrogenase